MGVEFNENRMTNYGLEEKKGAITSLVMKMGLAKDDAGARKVMLIAAVIFFALSIYFFFK